MDTAHNLYCDKFSMPKIFSNDHAVMGFATEVDVYEFPKMWI